MSGRRYNEGKPRLSLIRLSCLTPLARVLEYGRMKYSDWIDADGNRFRGAELDLNDENFDNKYSMVYDAKDNWNNGLITDEVLDSLLRHVSSLRDGELIDEESGCSHVGHIQANALFLGSNNIITYEQKDRD